MSIWLIRMIVQRGSWSCKAGVSVSAVTDQKLFKKALFSEAAAQISLERPLKEQRSKNSIRSQNSVELFVERVL